MALRFQKEQDATLAEQSQSLRHRCARHTEVAGDGSAREGWVACQRFAVLLAPRRLRRFFGLLFSSSYPLERRHELPGTITGGRVEPSFSADRTLRPAA